VVIDPENKEAVMQNEMKRDLNVRYLQAYNCFDLEGMVNTLSDEVEIENVRKGKLESASKGIPAFSELTGKAALVFSYRKQTILELEEDADSICINVDYEATLATDLYMNEADYKQGDTLKLNSRSEFTFAHDKISRIRDIC